MDITLFNVILTGGLMCVIFLIMFGGIWWLIHDQPINEERFSWHQLVKNSFHVSIIDKDGKSHTADIHYNVKTDKATCRTKKERRLQIYLPEGFTRKEFFDFAGGLNDIDGTLRAVIRSVKEEKLIEEFGFSKADVSTYREFKRYLLLKALRS